MPRQRPGLGQGLAALVAPARTDLASPPAATVAWEYATVIRKRKRTIVEVADGDPVRGMSHHRVRGLPVVALLGLLGTSGWELVGVSGRRLYLKRPSGRQ
jgi:hypothetical protein